MKEIHMSAQPSIDQQTREDEGSFTGVGGLKMFTRTWHPEGAPRAIVVIVPGFNSHSGNYRWVAEQFVAHGLAVHAWICAAAANRMASASTSRSSRTRSTTLQHL
jgi:alpha-beta hydrolase superfamily lysophospholipase